MRAVSAQACGRRAQSRGPKWRKCRTIMQRGAIAHGLVETTQFRMVGGSNSPPVTTSPRANALAAPSGAALPFE